MMLLENLQAEIYSEIDKNASYLYDQGISRVKTNVHPLEDAEVHYIRNNVVNKPKYLLLIEYNIDEDKCYSDKDYLGMLRDVILPVFATGKYNGRGIHFDIRLNKLPL